MSDDDSEAVAVADLAVSAMRRTADEIDGSKRYETSLGRSLRVWADCLEAVQAERVRLTRELEHERSKHARFIA